MEHPTSPTRSDARVSPSGERPEAPGRDKPDGPSRPAAPEAARMLDPCGPEAAAIEYESWFVR